MPRRDISPSQARLLEAFDRIPAKTLQDRIIEGVEKIAELARPVKTPARTTS